MRRTPAGLAAALLVLVLALAGPAGAQQPGEELRIYLATYGQGGAVWELFGHNALWVQDARTGRTRSYNWGMFDFGQSDFVPRLIRGSMRYWLEPREAEEEVAAYRYWDRSITVQELDLAPAQKQELREFVEWNALPANRFYDYHYFRDNCSTRVRDAIDRVLGGGLAAQLQQIRTAETFRSHSLRLTARAPLTYTGIELGLADSADHPLTAWEEAFIPMELMRRVRSATVTAADGSTRPLVLDEQVLYESRRGEPLAAAPYRVPLYLALGTALGLLFTLLARLDLLLATAGRRGWARAARWTLAVLIGAWSLLAGIFGTLVLLLWAGTGHTFTYGNESLLQVNPLPLLLAVLAPLAVLRGRASRSAFVVALLVAGLSLVGLLLKLLPGFDQMNHDVIALMLPLHLAVLAVLYHARDSGRHRKRTAAPAPRRNLKAAA